MATSPACFDIYMEDFLRKIQDQTPKHFKFWYLAYADDLVFTVELQHLDETLKWFEKIALDYNLKLNYKKSGIFVVKNNKIPDMPELKIPFVTNYKYLGV